MGIAKEVLSPENIDFYEQKNEFNGFDIKSKTINPRWDSNKLGHWTDLRWRDKGIAY